ncbi:transmembrane and ubiquitin-like domain-containing protein 1 [Protobothrops mucrosquamatus]|uniref:transmembrane and ubiquitin-like domain-containing protein 1 n=1 Tax=Protobothrops mucrosquamatus TaxID=103944 RepID=UPI00077569B3|nr:transmembrane and ubiquitin-like domain-containing protein 1 [Protobothrops mucrosquamatus]
MALLEGVGDEVAALFGALLAAALLGLAWLSTRTAQGGGGGGGGAEGEAAPLYFPGQEQLVRLIYQGQLLRDDGQTLAALHLTHNSVLHCHVAQRRASPGPSSGRAGSRSLPEAARRPALNVGGLMVPLMVLMLGALWYFQLQHRHAFTATATTCLAGLTLLFSFVAFAAYRR